MRLFVIAASAALLACASPAMAAKVPIVCGVRDESASAKQASALAEAAIQQPRPDETLSKDATSAVADGDRFVAPDRKLFLVLLDDRRACSETSDGRCKWGVVKPVTYRPSNASDTITVPPGFPTDLASIPSFAWPLLPPDGPWLKAAVIHDFLYRTCGRGVWLTRGRGLSREPPYTRGEADWILRDAMQDRGVGIVRRNIIWATVRLFGGGGWGH